MARLPPAGAALRAHTWRRRGRRRRSARCRPTLRASVYGGAQSVRAHRTGPNLLRARRRAAAPHGSQSLTRDVRMHPASKSARIRAHRVRARTED